MIYEVLVIYAINLSNCPKAVKYCRTLNTFYSNHILPNLIICKFFISTTTANSGIMKNFFPDPATLWLQQIRFSLADRGQRWSLCGILFLFGGFSAQHKIRKIFFSSPLIPHFIASPQLCTVLNYEFHICFMAQGLIFLNLHSIYWAP